MSIDLSILKNDEKVIFGLRSLYQKYGYSQYKMSKFEEYDLYVKNKDFLVSDSIITFTDTDGKLMALKPDVTFSIIKNIDESKKSVQKLYYNENVYRVSKGTHSFKEIMQTGLECLGDIDNYSIYEVIMLAAKSLESISEDYILDISHMGIISSVIDSLSVSREAENEILKCIGEKNSHTIAEILEKEGVEEKKCKLLEKLVTTHGTPQKVIPILEEIKLGGVLEAVAQLKEIFSLPGLANARINIDFSVINDMRYYNGVVFNGFINGISGSVLSGGQYDKLMQKIGKKSGAIGFAVYLDSLERFGVQEKQYDVDTVILYDENSDLIKLNDEISKLLRNGKSVMAQRSCPANIKYRELLKLGEGVEIIENNA